MALPRTPRARAAALLISMGTVALAGCSVVNPIITQQQYDPSDGFSLTVGDVKARNLLVIVDDAGTGVVYGALSNRGREDANLDIAIADGERVQVTVPAGSIVFLGAAENEVTVSSIVSTTPGLLAPVNVTSQAEGTQSVDVQVMDGTLEEYRDLVS